MINVDRIVNSEFTSCTYVVCGSNTREAIIIDPGNPDTAALEECISRNAVRKVTYVILTHEHFDHIAGANRVREHYKAIMVCSAACAARMADPKLNMSYYKNITVAAGPANWVCEEQGWILPWDGPVIELFPTPGHSPGGLCARIDEFLFSGDTLLGGKPAPTHLPGGDPIALKTSLATLKTKVQPGATVFPGHGEPFIWDFAGEEGAQQAGNQIEELSARL